MNNALALASICLLTACAPALPPAADSAVIRQVERVGDVWVFSAWAGAAIFIAGLLVITLGLTLSTLKVAPALGNALVNGARAFWAAQTYRMKAELARLERVRVAGLPDAIEGHNPTLALLDDAMRVAGGDAMHIPSWRELQEHGAAVGEWGSRSWQDALAPIRDYFVIRDGGGGGTVLRAEYGNLQTFARAVRAGGVRLTVAEPPYPTAEGAEE